MLAQKRKFLYERKIMAKYFLLFICLTWSLFGFELDVLDPVYESGVKGAYIGISNNALIVAGGIREDSSQSDIIVIEKNKYGSSRKYLRPEMHLPFPLAYGASISTNNGLICLGGANEAHCFSDAILLKWNKEKKFIEFASLPPLPFPLAHASATKLGNKLYVVGGVYDKEYQKPNRYLLELNLDSIGTPRWNIRSCLPGEPRINPAIATQSNGLRDTIYIFGGQNPITKEALRDAYSYDEQIDQWDVFGPIPIESNTISAAPSGANHIYINGEALYTFHTITNTWAKIEDPKLHNIRERSVITHKGVTYFGPSDENSNIFVHEAKHTYHFGKINTAIVLTYLSLMVIIGIYFSMRKKQTSLEYFKASFKIPWWAAGLSILGTEISTLNFLSVPAKAFASDWQYLVMDMTLILVIPLILYGFLPFFKRLRVTTAYEYLENRFNLSVRLISSTIYIIFELLRIGLVMYLPAIALSFITGWSVSSCIIMMGSLSVLYTALGGIEAVIWTDVIQVFVFVLAAILSIVFIAYDCQMSFSDIYTIAQDHGKIKIFDFAFDLRRPTFWVILFSSISYDIMNYGADQATVQRYLTVKSEKAAQKSIWLNVILCLSMGVLFYALGTTLYVFYRKFPEMMDAEMQLTDNIYAHYIMSRLPAGVAGIVITGIFAAAMSTLDSSINAIATTFTNDFFTRLGRNKSDKLTVKVAKWTTLFIGFIGTSYSLFLTRFKIISFLDYYDIAIAYTLCSVSGVFLLGIFTKRANSRGAIWGIFLSGIFLYFYHKYVNTHFLLLMSISTLTTFLFGYSVSFLYPVETEEESEYTVYR